MSQPGPNYGKSCGQYLRLSNAFTIDQAAALWCGGDPGQDVGLLRAAAPCFSIKHDLIFQAVMAKRLPVTRDGVGEPLEPSSVARDRMRIMRSDLIAWFELLPTGDRPLFLFGDGGDELPDVGAVAEMSADRAIAVMAWLLSTNKPTYKIVDRPNAAAIGRDIEPLAVRAFGDDIRGFASFHKRLGKALKTFETDAAEKVPLWHMK